MKSVNAVGTLGLLLAMLLLASACSGTPKYVFKKSRVLPPIMATGYGWGDKAEEKAKREAEKLATAMVIPNSLEFNYLQVDSYSMFKIKKVDYTDIKILKTQQLEDGGYSAIAQGQRSNQVIKDMRFKRPLHFEVECEGETFAERTQSCTGQFLQKAAMLTALNRFKEIPKKMRGGFTLYSMERIDDGKDEQVLKAVVFVGIKGKGDLEPEERAMVLMNAWHNTVAHDQNVDATALYQKAMATMKKMIGYVPAANFAREYALFEMSHNRLQNAIAGIKDALLINPHEMEYNKILYQLYKKSGNKAKMEEIQKHLQQLEMWEENVGADITGGFKFRQKIKWVEGGEEQDPDGMIHFQEMDEEEAEAMKANVSEE